MSDLVMSVLVLAALVMLAGAWIAWRRDARLQAGLMIVLALALIANVAIWTVPGADGPPDTGNLR